MAPASVAVPEMPADVALEWAQTAVAAWGELVSPVGVVWSVAGCPACVGPTAVVVPTSFVAKALDADPTRVLSPGVVPGGAPDRAPACAAGVDRLIRTRAPLHGAIAPVGKAPKNDLSATPM